MIALVERKSSFDVHGCRATLRETIVVREEYRGRVFWEGEVDVLDLEGHAYAERAYRLRAKGERDDANASSILHAGLVDSPQSAVRALIVHAASAREG